jgi:hypothetical protein
VYLAQNGFTHAQACVTKPGGLSSAKKACIDEKVHMHFFMMHQRSTIRHSVSPAPQPQ